MTLGGQQREFIAQTSEQGSPLQKVPPATAHKTVPVEAFFPQTACTKKLSVTERKREIVPREYQKYEVNIIRIVNLHSNWF